MVQQARRAVPPNPGGRRGQHELHVHAARADGRALPLVGQQPGVGDVAVQARREHEDHDAHLVTFAAEMLAGHAVAELVQDFGDAQRDRKQQRVLEAEERMKVGQAAVKRLEMDQHQQQRGKPKQDAGRHRRAGVEPGNPGVEPVQETLGIEALEADAENVRQGGQELLAAALAAALEQLLSLAAHGGDHQPAAMQHAEELLQLVKSHFLRRKLVFEAVLELVEADAAVQPVQEGVFLFLEAGVGQTHRVLHDPVAAAQVMLPPRNQVGSPPDRQRPGRTGEQAVVEGDHGRASTRYSVRGTQFLDSGASTSV